jgi:hypothetical protein
MLTIVLDCDSMSQYYTVWPPAGPPSGCPSRRLLRPLTRTGPPVHERSHERGHVHDRFCVRKVHERFEADVDRRRKCVYTAISFWKTHLQLVAYIGGRIQWCWVQHARVLWTRAKHDRSRLHRIVDLAQALLDRIFSIILIACSRVLPCPVAPMRLAKRRYGIVCICTLADCSNYVVGHGAVPCVRWKLLVLVALMCCSSAHPGCTGVASAPASAQFTLCL